MFYYVLILAFIFNLTNAQLVEKTVRATKNFDEKCLELSKSSDPALRCEFFRCFEERFPCGPQYWIQRWGTKYCSKYTDKNTFSSFSIDAQRFLNSTNECLAKSLETTYRTDKPLRCKKFYITAFKSQGKCYSQNIDLFCDIFPKNKVQFSKVTDIKDYMDQYFISMIKSTLGKCNPKMDLFSLMG
jgi:hypothetical protein